MSQKHGILSIDDQKALASIEGLPMSLKDIGETYGLPLVFKLVQIYGGTRLSIPMKLPDDHELIVKLGHEDAHKLHDLYRGDRIDIPRSLVSRECRDEMVFRMTRDGVKQAEIALACHCTERTIRNVLERKRSRLPARNTRQIEMFDPERSS